MANKFFSWREAILKSSLPPTTRHVLLTLACHMNDAGESCYPSIKLLCAETGLSNRAVITHIHSSVELGWLTVKKQGLAGQQWSRNSYALSWDHLNKAVNVEPEGDESNNVKAVSEVHTSTSLSTSDSTSINNKEQSSPAQQSFAVFWDAFPKHHRKSGKTNCLEIWKRRNYEKHLDEIIRHLEFSKGEWAKEDNKYVPMPASYLNKQGWDGWEHEEEKSQWVNS